MSNVSLSAGKKCVCVSFEGGSGVGALGFKFVTVIAEAHRESLRVNYFVQRLSEEDDEEEEEEEEEEGNCNYYGNSFEDP